MVMIIVPETIPINFFKTIESFLIKYFVESQSIYSTSMLIMSRKIR